MTTGQGRYIGRTVPGRVGISADQSREEQVSRLLPIDDIGGHHSCPAVPEADTDYHAAAVAAILLVGQDFLEVLLGGSQVEQSIRWIRWLILFVIAWLVGVYLFDLLSANWRWVTAGGMAMLSWLVNLFARQQATRSVKGNRSMLLWLTIPPTLFFLIPLSVNLYKFWTAEPIENGPTMTANLINFGMRHVVPVSVLLIVYWLLGRIKNQLALSAIAQQADSDSSAAE